MQSKETRIRRRDKLTRFYVKQAKATVKKCLIDRAITEKHRDMMGNHLYVSIKDELTQGNHHVQQALDCVGEEVDGLIIENAWYRQKMGGLMDFAYDVARNFDCDEDAHRHDTTCRTCSAEQLLLSLGIDMDTYKYGQGVDPYDAPDMQDTEKTQDA